MQRWVRMVTEKLLTRKIVNKCSGFNELLNYQTGA